MMDILCGYSRMDLIPTHLMGKFGVHVEVSLLPVLKWTDSFVREFKKHFMVQTNSRQMYLNKMLLPSGRAFYRSQLDIQWKRKYETSLLVHMRHQGLETVKGRAILGQF